MSCGGCVRRGGIGAGFRELRGVKGFLGAFLAAVLLAALATWAFFSASAGDLRRDPTEVAGDAFSVWEQWDGAVVGASAAAAWNPKGERPVATRFVTPDGAEVWHTTWKPEPLPSGYAIVEWGGGWLSGMPDALALWSEAPGEMAGHWRPRRDGHVRLEATGNPLIPFRSTWTSDGGSLLTEWHAGELEAAPLPLGWGALWEMPEQDARWHKAALRRVPGPLHAADSLLLGRWDGTVARLERTDGAAVELWGWADSTGVLGEWEERGWGNGSNVRIAARGLWRVFAAEDGSMPEVGPWADAVDAATLPGSFAWDQGERGPEGTRTARFSHDRRLTWAGGALAERAPAVAAVADTVSTASEPVESTEAVEVAVVPTATAARTLGRVRNHRTGGRMDIRWTGREVEAVEAGARVWAVSAANPPVSAAFEVDLYRNGKFQTALAFADGVWLIDVLGKQAPGYPLRVGSPVTALHVADYDRDAQFRFLIGTRDGRVHNYRDEAALTPGWTAPKGASAVTQLAHLRVASKDYIYVGHADGSVKLLARSGEDRAKTAVKVKSAAAPAFRLAGDIERSTVLFIDASGTVREQSFGDARPTGLDGKVKGEAVFTADRNGDGVPEVVVRSGGKDRVFDARGREVGGSDASRRD